MKKRLASRWISPASIDIFPAACWLDQNWNSTNRSTGRTKTVAPPTVSGPALSASFVYDGDGQRVKSTINGTITTFVGTYYEKTGGTVTMY
jgi:hypothetical protein